MEFNKYLFLVLHKKHWNLKPKDKDFNGMEQNLISIQINASSAKFHPKNDLISVNELVGMKPV